MILKSLYLNNYRGFREHTINFKKQTVIVGKNNAGKSTIIEALRLVAFVSKKFSTAHFINCPDWLKRDYSINLGLRVKGISPDIKSLINHYDSIFYYYREDEQPIYIKAIFEDDSYIEIYLGKEENIYALIYNYTGELITNNSSARIQALDKISILPQIGPLAEEEKILTEAYVKRSEDYALSSLHFRNQIKYKMELFPKFKEYMEKYSDNIIIEELDAGDNMPTIDKLNLFVQNEHFTVEIGRLGNGFQMWSQIIWFLTKSNMSDTIILDEPDVYLHADLQRKLYKLLISINKQFIIATHSIEIISASAPENILLVDKTKTESKYIEDTLNLQYIIEQLGSSHNLEMTKLSQCNKCIFIEGNDFEYLNAFYNILYNGNTNDLRDIPKFAIGGRAELPSAKNIAKFLNENFENNIECYCLIDKDYFIDEDIEQIYSSNDTTNLNLHIWNSKEIENYLINPNVISKICNSKNVPITEDRIITKIEEFFQDDYSDLLSCYVDSIFKSSHNPKNATKQATEYILNNSTNIEQKIAICRGKIILGKIKNWLQNDYGICFNNIDLIKHFSKNDIDIEIQMILENIKDGTKFE